MFHRIKEIQTLPDYCLLAEFVTGERKRYDVKPLFADIEVFKTFMSRDGLFEKVRVDTGGYGVVWNKDIDLASDEIWYNGVTV